MTDRLDTMIVFCVVSGFLRSKELKGAFIGATGHQRLAGRDRFYLG